MSNVAQMKENIRQMDDLLAQLAIIPAARLRRRSALIHAIDELLEANLTLAKAEMGPQREHAAAAERMAPGGELARLRWVEQQAGALVRQWWRQAEGAHGSAEHTWVAECAGNLEDILAASAEPGGHRQPSARSGHEIAREQIAKHGTDRYPTPHAQMLKVVEEVGELAGEVLRLDDRSGERAARLKAEYGDVGLAYYELGNKLALDAVECMAGVADGDERDFRADGTSAGSGRTS